MPCSFRSPFRASGLALLLGCLAPPLPAALPVVQRVQPSDNVRPGDTVTLAGTPFIQAVEPARARPGDQVIVEGVNLHRVQRLYLGRNRIVFSAPPPGRFLFFQVPEDWRPAAERPLPLRLEGPGAMTYPEALTLLRRAWTLAWRRAGPTLTGFQPDRGRPGDQVRVEGARLDQVRGVALGNRRIPAFTVERSGRALTFRIPESWDPALALPVPIRLTLPDPERILPRLHLESADRFIQLPRRATPGAPELPVPRVDGGRCSQERAGWLVALYGRNLSRITRVRLDGTEVPRFEADAGKLVFGLVAGQPFPDPHTAGFRLDYLAGPGDDPHWASLAFQGLDALPPLTGAREAKAAPEAKAAAPKAARGRVQVPVLYLTQGTQRQDGSVPLVQGRAACLRAFPVSAGPRRAAFRVRVTIRDRTGAPLLVRDIQPPTRGLPATVDENRMDRSWNLPIPGALVQPGNTVLAEVVRAGRTEVVARFPADGVPRALDVVPVMPIRLRLVPVRVAGMEGAVGRDGRSVAAWVGQLKRLLPVAAVTVEVAPPFTLPPEARDPGRNLCLEACWPWRPGASWTTPGTAPG